MQYLRYPFMPFNHHSPNLPLSAIALSLTLQRQSATMHLLSLYSSSTYGSRKRGLVSTKISRVGQNSSDSLSEKTGVHRAASPSSDSKLDRWLQPRNNWMLDRWQGTVIQLRLAPWKLICSRFCSHVLPMLTIVSLIIITNTISVPDLLWRSRNVCAPDGTFLWTNKRYNPWHATGLFQKDMAFGNMSFEHAKLLDFFWDLVSDG